MWLPANLPWLLTCYTVHTTSGTLHQGLAGGVEVHPSKIWLAIRPHIGTHLTLCTNLGWTLLWDFIYLENLWQVRLMVVYCGYGGGRSRRHTYLVALSTPTSFDVTRFSIWLWWCFWSFRGWALPSFSLNSRCVSGGFEAEISFKPDYQEWPVWMTDAQDEESSTLSRIIIISIQLGAVGWLILTWIGMG